MFLNRCRLFKPRMGPSSVELTDIHVRNAVKVALNKNMTNLAFYAVDVSQFIIQEIAKNSHTCSGLGFARFACKEGHTHSLFFSTFEMR